MAHSTTSPGTFLPASLPVYGLAMFPGLILWLCRSLATSGIMSKLMGRLTQEGAIVYLKSLSKHTTVIIAGPFVFVLAVSSQSATPLAVSAQRVQWYSGLVLQATSSPRRESDSASSGCKICSWEINQTKARSLASLAYSHRVCTRHTARARLCWNLPKIWSTKSAGITD